MGTTCAVLYLCIALFDGAWTAIQLQPSRSVNQLPPSGGACVRGDDVETSYLVQLLQELGAGDSITPIELLPASPPYNLDRCWCFPISLSFNSRYRRCQSQFTASPPPL